MRNGDGGNSSGSSGSSTRREKVRPESVIEAATLASNGQPFEVIYYPRASTPEFCVKASLVKAALQNRWCSGMRFKMPFETEDSSRISWFMGTISAVQVADPIRWPDSPWRLLQVTWDEPDLLQNVKHISPWLVELVSNMPTIHLSPFSPPRKKMRLPHHPDFPFDGQIPMPTFSSNLFGPTSPFNCLPDNAPTGMQGARHAPYGLSLSDLHLNKLQSGFFPATFPRFDNVSIHNRPLNPPITYKPNSSDDVSCLLTMGISNHTSKKPENGKGNQLVLFGRPILTEQQISSSCSRQTVSSVQNGNSSSEGIGDKMENISNGSAAAFHLPVSSIGHCKVFMESEDVGRTLDLSGLGSYDELYKKLANMFGIESLEILNHVLYQDLTGSVKQIGDELFSDFIKTAKRLTIQMDSSGDNVEI